MVQVLLFNKIAQLLIIAVMGYALVKFKVLKSGDSYVFSAVSLYLLLPCAVINAFQIEYDEQVVKNLVCAAVASLLVHILFITATELLARVTGLGTIEKCSVIYSNSVNMILPLVSYVLGEEWALYTMPYLVVQILFMWTHGISSFRKDKHISIKKIFVNVNMISIAIGAVMLFMRISLPYNVYTAFSLVGNMMGPTAMIIVGMVAAEMDLKRIFLSKKVYIATFLRLVFFPAVLLVIFKALMFAGIIEHASNIYLIVLLASIAPAATSITMFSQVYGGDEKLAGAISLVSTFFCIVTMPICVWLYML